MGILIKIILVIVGIGAGTYALSHNYQLTRLFGYNDYAERYLGTGGTYGAGGTSFAPATVGQMTANGGAGNTGAKKYQFEYAYAFSKRTEVSLGIAQVKNDAQSNILIGTGSTLPNFGETQSYYGLRMTHVF